MIYDCFLYNGEKDLVKIRAEEMKSLNCRHIGVCGFHTFSGIQRKLSFYPDELAEYHIDWRPLFDAPLSSDPWQNEKMLRNSIKEELKTFKIKADDTIIISDVDEVPRASAVKDWQGQYAALMMDKFGFWLNCQEQYQGWHRARIMKYSYLKTTTPEEVRNAGFPEQINDAGWHWSWLGGVDEVMRKFASFSHQEESVQKHANREELLRKIAIGESIWGQDLWKIIPIDSTFPQYVQDHQHDNLKHLIFHGNS